MSASYICKCHKCGYEEKVWYDDENYGYVPECRTEGCSNYGKRIFAEDAIIHTHSISKIDSTFDGMKGY